MTDYTDLKARLRAVFDLEHTSSEVDHVLIDALTYIEELEQRIQSMGGSSGKTEARRVAEHEAPSSGEPPAQSSAAPANVLRNVSSEWKTEKNDAAVTVHHRMVDGVLCRWWGDGPTPPGVAKIDAACSAAPAQPSAAEPVAMPSNIPDRLDLYADQQALGSQMQSDLYAAATHLRKFYAAPQPAQADEARELLREVMNELIVDPEASWPDIQRGEKLQERIDAYLVRTGGKEE